MLNVTTVAGFEKCILDNPKVVVHFWAGWCDPCSLLDQVLEQLENDSPSVTGVRVEAEEAPEISERCTVTVVPLIVFFSGGKEVDRLEGADAAALSSKFLTLAAAAGTTPMASRVGVAGTAPTEVATTVPLQERIEALVRQQPVMLFMKGSPDAPRCGFSRKVVEALQSVDQQFGSFDILTNEEVRAGLKDYSQWPTYPQVYCNGELLGGCDIVLEMAAGGELKTAIDDMLLASK